MSCGCCEDRKELDVLGIGAYDGEKLVGLAGCSADCEAMWQIGVDVLPAYRRQGVASALTSGLAMKILERQGSFLLFGVVQYPLGAECGEERIYSRVGGDDGEAGKRGGGAEP